MNKNMPVSHMYIISSMALAAHSSFELHAKELAVDTVAQILLLGGKGMCVRMYVLCRDLPAGFKFPQAKNATQL